MSLLESLFEQARQNPRSIVYPEGNDPRILQAAVKVRQMGMAAPIILGVAEEVAALAAEHGVALGDIPVVAPKTSDRLEAYAEAYATARDKKVTLARKLVSKPLSYGGMMVRTGDAYGMVAGVVNATASVIQAATLTVDLQPGIKTPSSFFLMIVPEFGGQKDVVLMFADCGVNIAPNASQLAEIAVASGHNLKSLLGMEPRIAMLSFSTKGSASHERIDKVTEALAMARELAPEFAIDGELQGDAALVQRVAAKKAPGSSVAGQANVLVFPDLDSGNIAYKLVQYLAGAQAFGPVLQGFAAPVNDLSRGASVDDIVAVTAITVLQQRYI